MKIVCVGGGPAGLYFACLMKLHGRHHDITILERHSARRVLGTGIVLWDDMLDELMRNDGDSGRAICSNATVWHDQMVLVKNQGIHLGGYGFGIDRSLLLEILARRAASLGVKIQFGYDVSDPAEFHEADLIVACDGINSRIRERYRQQFQTRFSLGGNRYVWLSTPRVLSSFTFAFERTTAGWIWFHAYPFNSYSSTVIVECSEMTWRALGFDTITLDKCLRILEGIFTRHLDGASLMGRREVTTQDHWSRFKCVTNGAWSHRNIVLMGDSAHSTHFTIGSGTRLAFGDAIALAVALRESSDLSEALENYENVRRAALLPWQTDAMSSMLWFERVEDHIECDPMRFAFALASRRGEPPAWRYLVHVATQIPILGSARRGYALAKERIRCYGRMRSHSR
jgi:anthraniloyl-CoA monooxygenase